MAPQDEQADQLEVWHGAWTTDINRYAYRQLIVVHRDGDFETYENIMPMLRWMQADAKSRLKFEAESAGFRL